MVEEEAVDHPIPDVPVSVTILVVSVAVVFTVCAVQCVLSGGPYTVASQLRQVHGVWPPPWPEAGLVTDEHRAGGEAVTVRASRRWVG
jgi:hypothetical protein